MALVAVEIPKVGLVMESVRIVRWLKGVGDQVQAGEPLLEVETEKSMVEIEAAVSGRLTEILAPVDQQAQVGDRIAWLETGEALKASPPAPEPAAHKAASAPGSSSPPLEPATSSTRDRAGERLRSSPVARRVAAEHGLDLNQLAGSGPLGRIQLADVQQRVAAGAATGAAGPPPAAPELSPMRRALARAMTLSNATVPQFSLERELNCTALQALRAEYVTLAPPGSPRLSINDFLLQAIARTLIEQPAMNATFAGDVTAPDARLVPARGAHIGLVVAVDGGLLVPVIHDAEQLSLVELARRRQDCVERGLKGRLRRDELEGATISISNLGANGPDRFMAMINPPQSAILAVGRQRDCVVAGGDGIGVRAQSALTLTVDHRVADGRIAALFLARLVEILEGRDWRLA